MRFISFQKPDWPLGTDLDRERAIATRLALRQARTDEIGLVGFTAVPRGGPPVEKAARWGIHLRFRMMRPIHVRVGKA